MALRNRTSKPTASSGAGRRPIGWIVAGVALGLLSTSIDRTTEVVVHSDGGRIRLEVAGTTLSAPHSMSRLTTVEIQAMDSIDPPGGRWIGLSSGDTEIFREPLPRRFETPPGEITPVGDWELDEMAGAGTVWRREVDLRGGFTLSAALRGRFLHDLVLVLHGDHTTSIAVRRGHVNNDCFIRDGDGRVLAATSIDPTPLADTGAIAATFARALALACCLIAAFTLLPLRSGPQTLAPPPARIRAVPLALGTAAVALSAWFAYDVLEGLPHTPDALVYLLQADWLLDGRLWAHTTQLHQYFSLPFTYIDDGRWLAHYPPGWPLLLAVGLSLGAPWLVAPLFGGLYIALLYLAGRELDSSMLGLAAATLALISPMTRILFGSMLSHAAASTLILAAFVFALRARKSPQWFAACAGGVALGLAFGIRPLTAVAVATPILALAIPVRTTGAPAGSPRRTILAFLGGCGLSSIPTLVTNNLITGNAFAFPYSLADGSMFGFDLVPFGIRNLDILLAAGGASVTGWGWPIFHGPWIIAIAGAPALIALLTRRSRGTDRLLAAAIGAVFVAYLGTRGHGLHGFGPRYHFEVYAPFFLLSARGFMVLANLGSHNDRFRNTVPKIAAVALFLALCLPAAAVLPHRLGLYRGYNQVDGSLEEQIAERAPPRALIVLSTYTWDPWQGWAAAWRLIDLRPDAPLLFIQTAEDDPEIPNIAGDRPVFLWQDGVLTPQ